MTSRYKNSPAIAMWEIINEPGEADWKTIRDFLHEIAAVIKKHDPYHLVESGTFAGCLLSYSLIYSSYLFECIREGSVSPFL